MVANKHTMPRERDPESGEYVERYTREAFLAAIREQGGGATTTEVSDALGCSYDLAYKRLRSLEDAGTVGSRRVGNARLWSVSDPTEVPA